MRRTLTIMYEDVAVNGDLCVERELITADLLDVLTPEVADRLVLDAARRVRRRVEASMDYVRKAGPTGKLP
jgi:hypothetical protein